MHTSEVIARANGIEIAFDTFGDKTCPPVLLIMGLSAQMIIWDHEFCARLAGRGFRVIRFDNRDAGRSTKLDALGMPDFRAVGPGNFSGLPYTLRDMANDTVSLLDALSIGSAHVVGASMGGMISQILAIEHPKRVRTLTNIMSSTGNPLLPPPKHEVLKVLFRPMPTDKARFIEHFVMMWKALNGNELPLDERRMRETAELSYERGLSNAGSARQLAAIMSSGSRKERLSSVKAPTLVIHGRVDPLLPLECGIDIALSIPGSRLEVIPRMGHALNPAVWDEIIGHIADHALFYEGC